MGISTSQTIKMWHFRASMQALPRLPFPQLAGVRLSVISDKGQDLVRMGLDMVKVAGRAIMKMKNRNRSVTTPGVTLGDYLRNYDINSKPPLLIEATLTREKGGCQVSLQLSAKHCETHTFVYRVTDKELRKNPAD